MKQTPGYRFSPENKILFFEGVVVSGGVKKTYRSVDVLNEAGLKAYVVHEKGERVTWFQNCTPVMAMHDALKHLQPEDIVVVDEFETAALTKLPCRFVVYNQNVFYGQSPEAYRHWSAPDSRILGILAVSDHNRELLQFGFPELRVLRIFYGFDRSLFQRVPLSRKKRQISLIFKKSSPGVEFHKMAYYSLMARAQAGLNQLGSYKWVFISGMTEREVANTLQDSMIFVFASMLEGCPLIVREAMLCGCLPITFENPGCPDQVKLTELTFVAGDILGMMRRIEEITNTVDSKPEYWQSIADAAYGYAAQYDLAKEKESILTAWEEILRLPLSRR